MVIIQMGGFGFNQIENKRDNLVDKFKVLKYLNI